ncbi:hypothetical protein GIB67_013851 [Kingdonia uniflora]|uniref:Uncharacterized protein n=1 Tax=Kingdonia uniflora TaxID=39325 RepID=A0A7J7N3Y0_9MAGN|nr:hypothetical protein GIB67_013851 [Kingdonia uniflora]
MTDHQGCFKFASNWCFGRGLNIIAEILGTVAWCAILWWRKYAPVQGEVKLEVTLHQDRAFRTVSWKYPFMINQANIETRNVYADLFPPYLSHHQNFSTGYTSVHGERPSAEYAKLRKESLETEFGHALGTYSSTNLSAYYRFGPFLALYRAAIISFQVAKLTVWHFYLQDINKRAAKFRETLIRLGPFYVKASRFCEFHKYQAMSNSKLAFYVRAILEITRLKAGVVTKESKMFDGDDLEMKHLEETTEREVHRAIDLEAQPKKTNLNPKPLLRIRRSIRKGLITSPMTNEGSSGDTVAENQEGEVPLSDEIRKNRELASEKNQEIGEDDEGMLPGHGTGRTGMPRHGNVTESARQCIG